MDAVSPAKPPSARLFWLIWLSVTALAAGSFFCLWRFGPFSLKATVFHQTEHGWERIPLTSSLAFRIQISEGGVTWVDTATGLTRYEGGSWRRFTAADLGTQHGFPFEDFTLDGDDVWGAAYDGVVHFDGRRWQHYPTSVATLRATSIAAANGQAWVVDREGNLSHFDGHSWTVIKANLPGVRWSIWSHTAPKLAATPNGVLWLVYYGLWRYSGSAWTRMSGASNEAGLLGVTPAGSYIANGETVTTRGGVWLADAGEVVGFNVDGAPVVRYKVQDLGLPPSSRLYAVAGRVPVLVVATTNGLALFDGHQWHAEPLTRLGISAASSVAVAQNGTVWGIGYPPFSANSALYRGAAFASLILPIFVIGYPFWWRGRRSRYQRRVTQEAVLHATGSLPEDLQGPQQSGWKTAAAVVVILFAGACSYWLLKAYWPAAPRWLLPVFWLGFHTVANVTGALKKRKPLPSDPIEPGGVPRYDWAKSRTGILGGLAVIVLLYGGSIARHFHIPWLAAVPGIGFLLGGQFLFHAYDLFRARRVEREIKQCRYSEALEMLDGPLCWPSTGLLKLQRAEALFYSGRAQEAEPILRDLVESEHDAAHKTLALENLGRVLMAQNRYDDARRAFEAAAKLMPGRSAAYSGLAELRLLQDVDASAALADAERALQLHRESLLERKGARERLSTIRGNQAWALARLGRSTESQQAIDAGAREMDPQYLPEVAGFYWRAGMATLAIENTTAAVAHFRRSVELDSQGYYGKLGAQHLSQHSVWGSVAQASRPAMPGVLAGHSSRAEMPR